MTARVASTVNNIPYMGEAGNVSADHGTFTAAAAAIADTIDLLTIPAGQKIIDVAMINAALGASSTVSLGWRYKDGSAGGSATAFLAATSTASAARTNYAGAPVVFSKDAVLYATVGGAAITGQLDVVTNYIAQGVQ